jgi:hypothetical protein
MTLLALILTAALAPKAPPEAELVTFVPRLDGLSSVLPFFDAAGTRSQLLRPESWRGQADPVLEVDLTSKASLEAAGIDPTGPLTISRLGDRTITCLTLARPELHTARVEERLARQGPVFKQQLSGASLIGSRDAIDRVLAAVATVGRESCSIAGNGLSVEKQLPLLVKTLLGKVPLPPPAVPGVVSFIIPGGSPSGTLSLSGKELTLTADLKGKGLPLAPLAGAGPSPYAALSSEGLLVLRARFAKSAMPDVVSQLTHRLPFGPELSRAGASLAPLLTGNAALLVSHVKVTTGLRSPAARLFAVRFALVAETSDPAAAKALLDALDPKSLSVREGALEVAVAGSTVILSNDEQVKQKALAALGSAAGKQTHAVELSGSPARIASALNQVPLLEAVQTPELAGLLAAGTELGPLLLASEPFTGWLDSAGGLARGQLVWKLDAAKLRAASTQ